MFTASSDCSLSHTSDSWGLEDNSLFVEMFGDKDNNSWKLFIPGDFSEPKRNTISRDGTALAISGFPMTRGGAGYEPEGNIT
jgi:hypothetical protein